MKILALHVDHIRFKPLKKALKSIKALTEKDKKEKTEKDALAVLTSVEKIDSDIDRVVEELEKHVLDISKQVNAKKVVLYPYAHLSNNLATPDHAEKVLDRAEKVLKKNFKVTRAPFGYYKEFEMKVKGHPLSELSRNIEVGKQEVEEVDSKALLKKMSKIKMTSKKAPKGLKSNIELGRDLDLYIVSGIVGHGLPLFTPRGSTIIRELKRFIEDEELKRGYRYTSTPVMAKSDLYKVSGHWQHYKDDMFVISLGKEEFALRPMTCPFQFILYKRKPRSYKDLPIKYAEIASLFRNEKSGELRGLSRVRQFSLADAHIICRPDQVESEFGKVLDLVKFVMKTLDVKDIWYRFSRGDVKNKQKYIDNPKAWRDSEALMKRILDRLDLKYVEAKDEAAFYGPKLDLQYRDVFGKEDTLFTIQIDFALPERYGMTYRDRNGKNKTPTIIHRSSIGAVERILGVLLEQKQGNLPAWLSPVQVKVFSMTDKQVKSAQKIAKFFKDRGIRVELDVRSEPISKKVRDAQLEKANYMITIGSKEEETGTIAVRNRKGKVELGVEPNKFMKQLKEEIKERL